MDTFKKTTLTQRNQWIRNIIITLTSVTVLFSLIGCNSQASTSSDRGSITIGGKDFAEQDILANILKILIENHTDLNVRMQLGLSSNLTWNAMKEDEIDLYVEYTGTGLLNILNFEPESDPDKIYEIVLEEFKKQYDMTWLEPLGFNNTYSLAMRKEHAEKLGITTISDMAAHSEQLVIGTSQGMIAREDAYPAMIETYNLNFKSLETMATGLWYPAIQEEKVDVITPYSTDGKIPSFDLTLLIDDKQLFPPYYAAPIIRNSVLNQHPELENIINKLANQLDEIDMQKLNEAVEIHRKTPAEVAEKWLKEKGLI
jgi:glycine betaine/choline ABC-type transport system substrate-binding protein